MSTLGTLAARRCAGCRYFSGAARELEAQLPGLRTLSSAYGAVRADDGVCGAHDRYVAAYYSCATYSPRSLTPIA